MDSSTKACESGKRNKFKFNPSTYKLAGRKHTVMLSRISKMSVFGIVALMLAFGLAADDANAQAPEPGTYVLSITEPTDDVAATATTTIAFRLVVDLRQDKGSEDPNPIPNASTPASEVRITIPNEWPTRPIEDNGDINNDAGEVDFSSLDNPTNAGRTVGEVRGRQLVIKIPEGAAGNSTYTVTYHAATAPARRGTYRFPVANANVVSLVVGYANSGTGTIVLMSRTPLSAKVGEGAAAVDHIWNKEYILTSEQDLGEVRLRYTAAGSMPKGTSINIEIGAEFAVDPAKTPSEVATVSGSGSPVLSISSNARTVTATVDSDGGIEKGNTITIAIRLLKAPVPSGSPRTTGLTLTATSTVPDSTAASSEFPIVDGRGTGTFNFYATMKAGTGELGITSDGSPIQNTAVVAGTELGTLTLAITGTELLDRTQNFRLWFRTRSLSLLWRPQPLPERFKAINPDTPAMGRPTVGSSREISKIIRILMEPQMTNLDEHNVPSR